MEAPTRGRVNGPNQGLPTKANVVALERNSIQQHHDPVNGIFKLSYIQVQLKMKMTGVIACHEMQNYTCIT